MTAHPFSPAAAAVPPTCFAAKAACFADLHAGVATPGFISNLAATVQTIEAGALSWPVTVNDAAHDNAWVCSPLTTYSRYALEETRRLAPRLLAPALSAMIGLADRWMRRAELDRAVCVNNWLVSTNLYPAAHTIDLRELLAACQARWPRHAVWLRSLNPVQHADWIAALKAAGFALIATRQVYLFRDVRRLVPQRQNLRHDLRLLRTTALHPVAHADFTPADFVRSEALYGQLYLDKYSRLNPAYTAALLQAWHRAGLLEFAGFRDDTGQLCAVVGLFGQGALLTAPIVGYDTAWPQSAGLYRLLMAHVLNTALQREAQVNLSAGAAHFKRLRGGEPVIEYSAVYSAHLPAGTRRALAALRLATGALGVPIMRHLQL
jgi:hypothetical protein